MSKLEKCINNVNNCYCNKMRECSNCSGNHIKDGKCELSPNDFCTCRNCGKALRGDGYTFVDDEN